jgi:ketosteroid isomerase-like protein
MLSLVAAGCATSSELDVASLPSELTTAVPALLAAWQGDNVVAFEPYYAENVIVVTPTDRYSGWSDVRARWITPALPAMTNFRATDQTFTREGNDIIETGRYSYTITQDGRTENMRGSFAQRWQRQADGSWRVASVAVQ